MEFSSRPLSSAGVTGGPPGSLDFNVCSRDPDSGPHLCDTSTLWSKANSPVLIYYSYSTSKPLGSDPQDPQGQVVAWVGGGGKGEAGALWRQVPKVTVFYCSLTNRDEETVLPRAEQRVKIMEMMTYYTGSPLAS